MKEFDKRMALEVVEDTLTRLDTLRDHGFAEGLIGAFYMCGMLERAEWEDFLKRIPSAKGE